MEEGEKKPVAGTISGAPQKKIVYAVLAVAVVILAVVLIAKFGYNTDLLNPGGGQMSLVQRMPTAQPTFSIRPTVTGIGHVPVCLINQSDCNGACVYLMTDARNCGACGVTCSGASSCKNGKCVSDPNCLGVVCGEGASCCVGRCVSNSNPNCGN
jgi:hypothetical protein